MPLSKERKSEYFQKMKTLLDTYSKVFVVQVDNVTSRQMQQTRHDMRNEAEVRARTRVDAVPLLCR